MPPAASPPPQERRRPRILVVDDDAELVAVLSDYLEPGHDVEAAAHASAALDIVVRRRPDLVLLDIIMPQVNGVEALQLIKGIDRDLPVIMVTASTEVGMAEASLRHGAMSVVPKPFKFEYLDHLIAVALQSRGARRK